MSEPSLRDTDYGPPRCICGRFTKGWVFCSDECADRALAEERDAQRREVEEQGMVPGV